ncbi:HD domain-containing protein [Egibacter rhizosphaerae]|uniref:HD domain-containing protein n=1 Tax=Egibacter rhizosphaerae TaxID=1670831 RepID=A0A411YCR4_9ACTN|nr:HD domain-containing phosphohydrolase [Egibacter rhizosphaerae]QBI18937.1 HD domain-containing protein [Egibacter rhizosphaerae]
MTGDDTSDQQAPNDVPDDAPEDASAARGDDPPDAPENPSAPIGDGDAPRGEPLDPSVPVHLDRIGAVVRTPDGEPAATFVAGLSDAARQRLERTGAHHLVEDLEDAQDVALAVVSTRVPRGELRPLLAALREVTSCPIVALVHTSGESLAVEILRAGGIGVVAEGNEAAIARFLTDRPHDQSMVETYDEQVGGGTRDAQRGRDALTGLPGRSVFEQRVDDLVASGEVPRVAYLRVQHLDEVGRRISTEAHNLVRRRLAVHFQQLCRPLEVDLYAVSPTEFAIIGLDLSPNRCEHLGRTLARVTETYAPTGSRPLAAAMGHAGPETSTELAPIQEVAKRALEVAVTDRHSTVVSAEQLALGVSSTTELEAAQRAVARVEQHDPYPVGHGQRVADLAGEIAWQAGFEGQARTRVMLAALLHDVGKVTLPESCIVGPDGLDLEHLEAYRTHPQRGAAYLRVSAGNEVADAVAAHHERWDGGGFPQGLAGEQIPMAARIIRLADAVEQLRHGVGGKEPLAPRDLLEELDARSGAELDPELARSARPVVDKMLTTGR